MAVDKLVDSNQLDANLTSVANAIRTKGGTAASLAFPAGFVSAVQAIPTGTTPTGTKQISINQNGTTTEDVTNYANAEITVDVQGGGGGGFTTIASGTFIGSNNSTDPGRQRVPIGKKMAKTDFWVRVWAKQGEEYERNGNYKWLALTAVCFKDFGFFDLSTDNTEKGFTESSSYTVDSNNAGTITQKKPGRMVLTGVYMNNDNIGTLYFNTFNIWRNRTHDGVYYDGFTIYLGHGNQLYPFIPITFEYEVVYFGNDPSNDIIDLS
jgi:hypothetical protein